MTVFAQVQLSPTTFENAASFLTQVDVMLRTSIMEKALRAAGAPVVKWAKHLAPQSIMTGSFELQSKKTRASRAGTAPHVDSIGYSTVRSYQSGTFAIYVGPKWPSGNLINVIGHPHKQMAWGRPTGKTIQPTKYLEQASQLTISDQRDGFMKKVTSEVAKILAKGASP